MPPPAVLRKRHTLTGKDIFPLIKRVRGAESPAGPLARLKMNAPTETMTISEMKTAFRELSGESLEECLQMVGDTANIEEGMKKLLHYAIIYANEVGQPDGQDISQDEQQVGEPQAKKQKKEHALEKRIEELEQSKRNEGEEELKSLKAKDFEIEIPEWEKCDSFDPEKSVLEKRGHPTWITLKESDSKPAVHKS